MKQNHIRLYTALAVVFISFSIKAALIELKDESHFNNLLAEGKPTVLDFYATWCGVCKRVKPDVDKLAQQHSDVNFILIDGDKHGGLKRKYGTRAYPTFVFLDANGKEVDRVVGRNVEAMKKSIAKIKKSKPTQKKTTEPMKLKPAPAPAPAPANPIEIPTVKKAEVVEKPAKEMPAVKKPAVCVQPAKPAEEKKAAPKPATVEKPAEIKGNHIELGSEAQFETLSAQSKPMVIDFFTTWCGPCKTMKPVIAELAKEYPDVNFVIVDAEKFPTIAKKYPVTAYPTFIFLDAMGKQVDKHSGTAAPILMKGKINKATGKNGGGVIVMEEKEVMQKMPSTMKVQEVKEVKEMPMPTKARRGMRKRY
jgi:thioredoxin